MVQERCNDPSVKEISERDGVFTRAFSCKRIYPTFTSGKDLNTSSITGIKHGAKRQVA